MAKLSWYWHRLCAMSPRELALRARKQWRQWGDSRGAPAWLGPPLMPSGTFPKLPLPGEAPEVVRAALRQDVDEILAGHWRAFGQVKLNVDDPPKWQHDYLAGKNLATTRSAFRLNHRSLPGGADIKLVWELSRWNQLVRLAMAAHVSGNARAGEKCLDWLEDWVERNPPYSGWNWTSALEAGLRLVQFTWIDSLLARAALSLPAPGFEARLSALRDAILPAHVRYTWRHRSFGSSANNHLLGELAGLIVAAVRWPALERAGTSLDTLQREWEQEVLAQFAADGGNREQALNYHLFSWEFCWQAWSALRAAGRTVALTVEQRLALAAGFYGTVQVEREPWDYGDSDNGYVTPFFAHERTVAMEWREWMRGTEGGALAYWCGPSMAWPANADQVAPARHQICFPQSGIYIARSNGWTVRWDLSPLGYLVTAAHGHLDALHLSCWCEGVAIIVDPGTGAYYGDASLRQWLASRAAHNGPCPDGVEVPKRLGPFLWSAPHLTPELVQGGDTPGELRQAAQVTLGEVQVRRTLVQVVDGWMVEDSCATARGSGAGFTVLWQFAPGSRVKPVSERRFSIQRADAVVELEVDSQWSRVELIEPGAGVPGDRLGQGAVASMEGIVSPAFRMVVKATCLRLTAPASEKTRLFRTTFRRASG